MKFLRNYFKKEYFGGAFLIVAAMVANLINFAFNAYLGRKLELSEFSLISLFGSFYSFANIGFGALGSVINYRGGFLIERYGVAASEAFLFYIQKKALMLSSIASVLWLLTIPFLAQYFHTANYLLFILFIPIWFFGFITAVNRGYISSKLQFGLLGGVIILEPVVKFLSAIFFVGSKVPSLIYLSIPIAIMSVFVATQFLLGRRKKKSLSNVEAKNAHIFPLKYLLTSLLAGLATLCFLSFDVILARHYLTPVQAGQYALISLIGKMVYFMSGLSSQFLVPLVSHYEGARKDSKKLFYKILGVSIVMTLAAFIPLGILSQFFAPLMFGAKVYPVLKFLPMFLLAMMAFSISGIFVGYYQVRRIYIFPIVAFLLSFVQIALISILHSGVSEIVAAMVISSAVNLSVMLVLHFNERLVKVIEFNLGDFVALFKKQTVADLADNKLNILIFNWRDTKHKWGGGAEAYLHELGMRWVAEGNSVTIFCGNDYANKRDEMVNGVRIMRRGGFYTMYVWATVYYVFNLRGKYDLVIDSENGIPFFTPLFCRKPIFLLIHHVHQEVFTKHLKFPFSQIARLIEGKLMPYVYREKQIITVSESSKKEIIKLGFVDSSDIKIVNPGIELSKFGKAKKTKNPSIVYIGRLKPYKNVEIAIKAFRKVVASYPHAVFHIAGEGESRESLVALSTQLGLSKSIIFHGKVSERKKAELLATSWVAVQPSMIEGWGITVIEANASGTPVIASNVNGLRDSIIDKKTGLLVRVKDVNEFAHAMLRTLDSKSFRAKITKSAYAWSKNFDWNKSANSFFMVIQNAVVSVGPRSSINIAVREKALQ